MFYFRDIYKKELTHKWNYCIKRTSIGISDKSYRGLETSNWLIRHQKWLLLNLQQPLNLYIKNNNKRVNTASTVIQSSPIRINKNELFLTSTLTFNITTVDFYIGFFNSTSVYRLKYSNISARDFCLLQCFHLA